MFFAIASPHSPTAHWSYSSPGQRWAPHDDSQEFCREKGENIQKIICFLLVQMECGNFSIVPFEVTKIEMVWIRFIVASKPVGNKKKLYIAIVPLFVGICPNFLPDQFIAIPNKLIKN
jgi:hypothetical protein